MKVLPGTFTDPVQSALYAYDILDGSVELMAGWIEAESGFDPWAMRFEPAFMQAYIIPLRAKQKISDTEAVARATSWGLLQMMGQTAREFGYTHRWLSALCEPTVNLELAAKILRDRFNRIGRWDGALAAYNGGLGGNLKPPYRNVSYVEKVLAHAREYGYRGRTVI